MITLLLALLFSTGVGGIGRPAVAQSARVAPKYRIGLKYREIVSGKRMLFMQISVDAKYFNREDMLALARALRDKYGKREEGGLNVAICDDYELAKSKDLAHMLLAHEPMVALRGFMDTNPPGLKAGIEFSTERGRPYNEISIDLDDPN